MLALCQHWAPGQCPTLSDEMLRFSNLPQLEYASAQNPSKNLASYDFFM